MCTKLSSIIGTQGTPTGKKVTIMPRNGDKFQGKISKVNRNNNTAMITEKDTRTSKSVSLSTDALSGWPS